MNRLVDLQKKFWFIIFFGFLISTIGHAQIIQVKEKLSLNPVENVLIYAVDESDFIHTDINGQAELKQFNKNDILVFQHSAFQTQVINFKDLEKMNYEVLLSEKVIKIDEVVVSANKWEQDKSKIPAQIENISPKVIAQTQPQTTADLLGNTGKIFVQKSQLGGGSPIIRGFAANSVLIVVDGVRMNNAIYRSGNLQNVISLDAMNLEGAEVIFGPGSVIYGSDALGGVMDFHTKRPDFRGEERDRFSGSALMRYSSANNEKTGHIDLNFHGNRLAALTSITYSDFDDLMSGSNYSNDFPDFGRRLQYVKRIGDSDSVMNNRDISLQIPSGYNQFNLMQKLKLRPSDALDVTYAFHFSTSSDIPRYDRLTEYDDKQLVYAEWYYGPQNWMMHHLSATWYNSNYFFDEGKIVMAYQDVEESRHRRKLYKEERRSQIENVDIFSLNADMNKELNDEHEFFYGLEAFTNSISSNAYNLNIRTLEKTSASTRYPGGGSHYNSSAVYFSYQWDMSKSWILNTGFRYTHNWLYAEVEDNSAIEYPFEKLTLTNGAINGSLGFVYKPNRSWKFDMLLSTGFRTPNLDDVGKLFDFTDNYMVVPNEHLKPEYLYNSEISIRKNINEIVQIDINGFYSHLDQAIVRRDFSFRGQDSLFYDDSWKKILANVNAGRAYVLGGSLALKADINQNISLSNVVTVTEGKDSEGIPLRHVAPLFGKSSVHLRFKKLKAEIFAVYNGSKRKEDMPPSELAKNHLYSPEGSLSWYTVNFKGSYYFNKFLRLNAGVENILNKHYRPYSSGISAPGRNFIISVSSEF